MLSNNELHRTEGGAKNPALLQFIPGVRRT